AVNDVSLELISGVYGLLGPNGAGKTTLMKLIVDILTPSAGRITLDGVDITELGAAYRDKLGYMPQEIGVYKNFSAKKFLKYIAALKGLSGREAESKVSELLGLVGLKDVANKRLGGFSGGMLRRIGIAQTLLNDPQILILDEPTAGLDPQERIRFRNILSELSGNRIVLISTHIVTDMEFIAGQIILLKDGAVLRMDHTENLIRTVEGKVWSAVLTHEQFNSIKQLYSIGNVMQRSDGMEVRIISDKKPLEQAKPIQPILEDVYTYYFGGTAK
ncbi:MAG TPA: ABC transporter ATP-binding protein, partial [Clostridiaceae bacterium]|nr:ABC transporter ATP-binding protein [Clostridiaceae bacterium]